MVKQILPKAGEAILQLFQKLGGNMNNVLGSRSNITFLGKGKNPEGFIDSDINIEAIGVLGKNKVLEELESSIGYLTAGKLNDVQANKLLSNMQKVDEVFNPKQIPNITDMATGTRDLTQEGLGALRATADDLPPPGSRGGPDDIAAPFQDAETTIRNLEKQDPELAAQFRAVVTNQGGTPAKRATAREFLVEALKEDDLVTGKTTLGNVISAEDVKYITEGGGGIGGDPLILVEKYFGPRIRDMIPENASSEEIVIFTKRVLENVVDAAGNKPNSPRFDRMTAQFIDEVQDFADGGRAGFFGGGLGRFGKMGYQALRKYGFEAEDITRMFKELSVDRSLVGREKTEYFKVLNKALKNPDQYPDAIKEMQMKLGIDVGTGFADGGRVNFIGGGPAGGASAGGNYGGNVNPDQEYAGSTFNERFGTENDDGVVGGGGGDSPPVVNDPVVEQPNIFSRGINYLKSGLDIFGDDDEDGTGTVSQATVDAVLNPKAASDYEKLVTGSAEALPEGFDPNNPDTWKFKNGGLAKILEV